MYAGLGTSDPFSVFIESKRDIGGIELPISDLLPRTMRSAEYWKRVPASKESTIRRKRKVLSHHLGDWLSQSKPQSVLDWFRRQRLGGRLPMPYSRQRPQQLLGSTTEQS
jgi:hypothetical protein